MKYSPIESKLRREVCDMIANDTAIGLRKVRLGDLGGYVWALKEFGDYTTHLYGVGSLHRSLSLVITPSVT